jgi:hypothetical protein
MFKAKLEASSKDLEKEQEKNEALINNKVRSETESANSKAELEVARLTSELHRSQSEVDKLS